MQCSINYNQERQCWVTSNKGKIGYQCATIFSRLIDNINLFNGKIPPFMLNKITHDKWLDIKRNTTDYNDQYIDIPSNTISLLYKQKGCQYIQISDGYGLYHLGDDICHFDVPNFIIPQQLRVRTKIHARQDKYGYCCLSVIIACQPKDIKKIEKSSYSLDDINKLPKRLTYNKLN